MNEAQKAGREEPMRFQDNNWLYELRPVLIHNFRCLQCIQVRLLHYQIVAKAVFSHAIFLAIKELADRRRYYAANVIELLDSIDLYSDVIQQLIHNELGFAHEFFGYNANHSLVDISGSKQHQCQLECTLETIFKCYTVVVRYNDAPNFWERHRCHSEITVISNMATFGINRYRVALWAPPWEH